MVDMLNLQIDDDFSICVIGQSEKEICFCHTTNILIGGGEAHHIELINKYRLPWKS
jgi:hypothetical protein